MDVPRSQVLGGVQAAIVQKAQVRQARSKIAPGGAKRNPRVGPRVGHNKTGSSPGGGRILRHSSTPQHSAGAAVAPGARGKVWATPMTESMNQGIETCRKLLILRQSHPFPLTGRASPPRAVPGEAAKRSQVRAALPPSLILLFRDRFRYISPHTATCDTVEQHQNLPHNGWHRRTKGESVSQLEGA